MSVQDARGERTPFGNVFKVVHEVLYSAYRESGEPDSDDGEDPVTGEPEFEAFATDLHQSGRQTRRNTQTHSIFGFSGGTIGGHRIYNASHNKTASQFGPPPDMPGVQQPNVSTLSSPLSSLTLGHLRAAFFDLNNVNRSQGLIVDLGSTVSVEPTTKHTIKVHKLHFARLIKMGMTSTRTEHITIRLYLFPSSKDGQTAFVVLHPTLIGSAFTVSILSDQSFKEDRLQLIAPPRSDLGQPPFIYRLQQGAASDPLDVRAVATVPILNKRKGGLVTRQIGKHPVSLNSDGSLLRISIGSREIRIYRSN